MDPGVSPHIIARGLSDRYGICLRSGFHCAQPLHSFYNVPASIRLSFWLYNTENEIEQAIKGIANLINLVR
jgi:cysteine desulfurase/selenocysteine lyase